MNSKPISQQLSAPLMQSPSASRPILQDPATLWVKTEQKPISLSPDLGQDTSIVPRGKQPSARTSLEGIDFGQVAGGSPIQEAMGITPLSPEIEAALQKMFPGATIVPGEKTTGYTGGCFGTHYSAQHIQVDGKDFTVGLTGGSNRVFTGKLSADEVLKANFGSEKTGKELPLEPQRVPRFPGLGNSSANEKLQELLKANQRSVSPEVFDSLKNLEADVVQTLLDKFPHLESLQVGPSHHQHPVASVQVTVNNEAYTLYAIVGGFVPHQGNWSMQAGHTDDPLAHLGDQ